MNVKAVAAPFPQLVILLPVATEDPPMSFPVSITAVDPPPMNTTPKLTLLITLA